jgi:hypothetical protein
VIRTLYPAVTVLPPQNIFRAIERLPGFNQLSRTIIKLNVTVRKPVQGPYILNNKNNSAMKTIQKTIALSIATLTASFAFGQLGLGVTSTTQAAVNATASTNAVLQTTQATTAATKATVNATTTKAIDVSKSTAASVNTKTATTVAATKTEASKAANVTAGTATNASSQSQVNAQSGNNSVHTGLGTNAAVNADVQVNGGKLINKADGASTAILANAENKAIATVETTKSIKAGAETELKAGVQSTGQAVSNTKPSVNAAADIKTETKASVNKH